MKKPFFHIGTCRDELYDETIVKDDQSTKTSSFVSTDQQVAYAILKTCGLCDAYIEEFSIRFWF